MKTNYFLLSIISLFIIISCSSDEHLINNETELSSEQSSEKTIKETEGVLCDSFYVGKIPVTYVDNGEGDLEERLRKVMKHRRAIKHLYRPTDTTPCPEIRMPYGSCRYEKRTGCDIWYDAESGYFMELWDDSYFDDPTGGKRSLKIKMNSSEL